MQPRLPLQQTMLHTNIEILTYRAWQFKVTHSLSSALDAILFATSVRSAAQTEASKIERSLILEVSRVMQIVAKLDI
eukprot:3376148-Amphidinium_carterae.1